MPIAIRAKQAVSRRQLLVRSAATLTVASLARPYLSRAADRPLIASGIQSGDVSADSAVLWARADRTAPEARSAVSFAWAGHTTGQGWGIDESRGRMRAYRTMLDNRPDFFSHAGDQIYADCPVERQVTLPDRGGWRSRGTEEKCVVA